jgi:hypothetical protein
MASRMDHESIDTIVGSGGFCGVMCGMCGKTANVPRGGAGWLCDCGSFRLLSWSGLELFPHEVPAFGPSVADIRASAERLARKDPTIARLLGLDKRGR